MDFKDRIFYVRMLLNLSQEALARELHVSFATINRWEKGRSQPNNLTLNRFEEFCAKKGIKN